MVDASKGRTQSFSVALSVEMVEQVDKQLADSGMSRSAWIRKALELQLKRDSLRQQLQQREDLSAVELVEFLKVLDGEMPAVKQSQFKNEAIPDVMWVQGFNDAGSGVNPAHPNNEAYFAGWCKFYEVHGTSSTNKTEWVQPLSEQF